MDTNPTTTSVSTEKWVLVAAILASSMAFIDSTALNVALPALQADLNVRGAELLWIINAYALFLSALILVGGSLGDHYGRKRVFGVGIGIFTTASLICGLAPDSAVLIMARAVQGVGGALMVPGSLAILSASFGSDRRGRAIGTWSTFSTLTTIIGPVIGGWLAGQGLWRAVFFINLPIAAVALFALTHVPESRDESASEQLDYLGALLATLGLASLTYGFIEAPAFGLADPRIFLTLIGGAAALIVFVIVEARSDHPMVPLRLFRSRTFSGANVLTLFLYGGLSGGLFFLPLNLIQVQGYPEEIAGFSLLPFAILLTLLSRWAGGLIDRVGPRIPLTIGPLITGFGFLLFVLPGLTAGPSDYWSSYLPAVIVLGIGMGITVAPLTTAVMGAAPKDSVGTASGINNAVARSAGVLAIAVLGALALAFFSSALETRTDDLDLAVEARAELRAEANKLADADVPRTVPPDLASGVENAIKWAFVDTFRLIALITTGLAWISALLAFLLISRSESESPPGSPQPTHEPERGYEST